MIDTRAMPVPHLPRRVAHDTAGQDPHPSTLPEPWGREGVYFLLSPVGELAGEVGFRAREIHQ